MRKAILYVLIALAFVIAMVYLTTPSVHAAPATQTYNGDGTVSCEIVIVNLPLDGYAQITCQGGTSYTVSWWQGVAPSLGTSTISWVGGRDEERYQILTDSQGRVYYVYG